ncbi:alpha/beta hydrolase [Acidimangrovimonas pyrenivorans]|uniref:Alpha/beta hydrolase n=1 Tax=Acidimangrovimonas pyrenivorans TaxID=2030798 RepID=A0ABV7AEH4_9RHOB
MDWRRHDTARAHFIASSDEPGLRLHLRAHEDDPARPPVLFVHGATYASRLYDIPHPGASWLKAAAAAGFAAYALDIRGYGRSRSAAMAAATGPYARATEAIRDIDDAMRWLAARHGRRALPLVGGSWGSITTALYTATLGAGRVARLVLYAPIFAAPNPGWHALLADPSDPARLNPAFGACRWVTEAGTRERWDAEIPEGADWRDEAVLQALFLSSLADDPLAAQQSPPAFRAPNGTFCDLWQAFNGRPLYDPGAIRCPVQLLRGGADPTSTRADALALFDALGSEERQYVEIANGAHFVSAERQAPAVFAAANSFLAG